MAVESQRSIVVAADVESDQYEALVQQMAGVEGLSGIKLGFVAGLDLSLPRAVEIAREADETLELTYDHQKAATDIPETGAKFAKVMENAGVDNAILFPFTGPVTQEAWTRELQQRGIRVISGSEMTHDQIAASPDGLSGGYVHPEAFKRMFAKAVELDVRDFVVPGNKPSAVEGYRQFFDREIGEGEFTLWAPGFVTQGGDVSETGLVAGPRFNAIVGSGIYKAEDPRAAATMLGQNVLRIGE